MAHKTFTFLTRNVEIKHFTVTPFWFPVENNNQHAVRKLQVSAVLQHVPLHKCTCFMNM